MIGKTKMVKLISTKQPQLYINKVKSFTVTVERLQSSKMLQLYSRKLQHLLYWSLKKSSMSISAASSSIIALVPVSINLLLALKAAELELSTSI